MSTITKMRDALRIGPFAAFDLVGTVAIAYGVSQWLEWPPVPTIAYSLLGGHIVHLVIGQDTPGTRIIKFDK